MAWEDLYRRAIGLRRASLYVNITALVFAFWTMIVTVSVIRQLDALSESLPSGGNGINAFLGAFSPAPKFVDYADDVEDRRELAAARADDNHVPWDEVKAALGLG